MPSQDASSRRPNVVLIICDDLNDYVEGLGGHPQAKTPNITRLIESGVSFQQAHCTIPICAPSRASFLTGVYPHQSGNFGFDRWNENEVLRNSRTMMDHFRQCGYRSVGSGKILHHNTPGEWSEFAHQADYGPFAFDGEENVAHPDVPAPFRDIGPIDGSFGPLESLEGRSFADGKPCSWRIGNWRGMRDLRVDSDEDRDRTPDEINADWAVEMLQAFADDPEQPFFLGVGFLRPHTPLIVPPRFFDQFPLETLELPVILQGDVEDTLLTDVREEEERGTMLYRLLRESYDSDEEALKRFVQAYLACVASVDESIGRILDAVDGSPLRENTIVVLTSDHGWQMGQKDYLFKNSLWEESTRVPLIIRAPGVAKAGGTCDRPVSMIDIYPTLVDLCDLPTETRKSTAGRPLAGHSLRPLLVDPEHGTWDGPEAVLTARFEYAKTYDPLQQSYSLRSTDWRYIRYSNGDEELYDKVHDPREWTNVAADPDQADRMKAFRSELSERLTTPVPAPAFDGNAVERTDAERWKDTYFERHPTADANRDGVLTWPEYHADKKMRDARKSKNESQ